MADVVLVSVGDPPFKVDGVLVVERHRKPYLRWRTDNWRRQCIAPAMMAAFGSLHFDTKAGKPITARYEWLRSQAREKHEALASGKVTAEAAHALALVQPLTFAEGLALAKHADTGKYLEPSAHRNEVIAAITYAARVFATMDPPVRTWIEVKRAPLVSLWRARIRDLRRNKQVGHRGAEITIARLLAVATWLRDNEHIPAGACIAPRDWKSQLKADWLAISGEAGNPEPKRPRYTIEEMRRILSSALTVDPRFGLLMAVGAEQRLGQVVRARRVHLDLANGLLTIPSRGQKRGAMVELTAGQMRVVAAALAVGGYLEPWERTLADYPLFPGGFLRAGQVHAGIVDASPMSKKALHYWFKISEKRAGVEWKRGRGAYGVRRVAVDGALSEHISAEGLQAAGGWTDSKMPMEVYRAKEGERARAEAAKVRAIVRGEETP